jgi:hypothetical protein
LSGIFPATSLSEQLMRLQQINEGLLAQEIANYQERAQRQASGSSSSGGSLLGSVAGFLGGGLGLAPLVGGLASLFGGGSDSTSSTAPVPYFRPPSLSMDAGFREAGGAVFATDTAQGGASRPVTSAAPAQITVNVQAMDSKSFMDRSNDIALAVRQAMLESSVLNDVIREI